MSVLQLEEVTKRYGDKTAVNGISLQVERGEIFGLLGGNGAGKTTTMRMVLGLIYPDDGKILYNGKPYSGELLRKLGYLPEERGLYPKIKVSEQILYLAELRGVHKHDADKALKGWLEKFGVPDYYGKKVEELSKGNQQKIQFIAAIIHNPDILILDEAFSGLDPVNVELLKATVLQLRDEGKTILFSSHRMDHVEELCRNICILHKSNTVLKGSLRDIKNSYPKERVLLETAVPVTGLEGLPGVTQVKSEGGRYEFRVTEPAAAQRILQQAMSQTDINRFQILEPTLTEIFIKKVGDGE
ncbi:ABC transporter ATP-binding protein [Gorillibacterium timonense]|uniref:ABC transporter ATP-binding protein n=1 Tax=Gorillibacterium timonense TaxID=1689269 RepID=UPI00071D2477|nr:ABC transporter ATP-binding protein [Gorillibacterium timonense]